ncbi:MAG: signal peptidase II [Spirochaetaceae bacterium]|nr:MAG: signal peptidase II [Spirochaetaceae bacterium]
MTMREGQAIDVLGDFFRIRFVRNPNIIFGFGSELPEFLRPVILVVFPVLAVILLVVFCIRAKDLKDVFRLPLAAIVGGGLGNLVDRMFRPEGVVDFLDFNFYGILGWNRFPTFNIADSSITIGVSLIFIISVYHEIKRIREKNKQA